MVHVVKDYTDRLQVIMDDKSGGGEEKNPVIDLPSMGLGSLLDRPEGVRSLMSRIRRSDGMTLVDPSEVPKEVTTKHLGIQNGSSGGFRINVSQKPSSHHQDKRYEAKPGTSGVADNVKNKSFYGKTTPFTSSTITPFTSSTINMEQLGGLDNEYTDSKNVIFSTIMALPELEVKTAEYTRFRYASERPDKGKKKRQYEMDEDKRFLADVKVTNHCGAGVVIIHCTDSEGNLHPYHLDGEDCVNGVYYNRMEFTPRSPILKITKTTIIQPKAKQYQMSLRDQREFLLENKAIDGNVKNCENFQDKQCVHFHVKVLLDNGNDQSFLNTITDAIRNKKDGTEFKIHAVTPQSAMANGSAYKSQKVYVMVTQETAFPKDVAVVFRHKEIDWEKEMKGSDITIIKKAFIELTPPPYINTSITENVEVDVCLKDCNTGKETTPAKFLYIGDEYGTNAKRAKKRKREDFFDSTVSSIPEPNVQAQKKMVQGLRTLKSRNTESPGCDSSSSSGDSTPHNSLGFTQDNSMITDKTQHTVDVSLEARRANKSANSQTTATVNILAQGGSDYIDNFGMNTNSAHNAPRSIVTSSESLYSNTAFSQFLGDQSSLLMANNSLQIAQLMSRTPDPAANIQPSGQMNNNQLVEGLSPDMLLRLCNMLSKKQVNLLPEVEKMVWERCAKVFDLQEQTIASPTDLQQTAQVETIPTVEQLPSSNQQVQSFSDLPVLPPDCQYAIIKGQIMMVKNDLQETNIPDQGQQVNIAGQDVIIQQMDPQQPTEDIQSLGLTSAFFRELAGNISVEPASTSLPSSHTKQPPPQFWRATTGTTSNLEDDDDIEVDTDTTLAVSNVIDTKAIGKDFVTKDMEVDGDDMDTPMKTHEMKLRGKKINYKDKLTAYEDALKDIKEDCDNDQIDDDENYKLQKRKYNKGKKEKKSQHRGKAMYEDDNEVADDGSGDTGANKHGSMKTGRICKGKDLKLVKKMTTENTDENSQGFECSTDS